MTKTNEHINEKIIAEIQDILESKYSIYINSDDWKLFKEPLIGDNNEKIDVVAFEERQKKSIYIIEKILNINDKKDIMKFLGRLAKIELTIQELQPKVRDHVVHALNTFILGVYILEKVDFPPLKNARFGYPFMWKLCGPTHDIGYPIEIAHNIEGFCVDKISFDMNNSYISEMNDILNDLNSPSPKVEPELFPKYLDELCTNRDANKIIQKRLECDWKLGIDVEKYYDWLKEENKTDHGVVGALAQLKVIDAIYYKNNPKMEYGNKYRNNLDYNQENFDIDIVNACSALFIHNISSKYEGFKNKISFKIAPLAFLLFLCDTFQEYDRHSENRTVYSGNDFKISCNHDFISLSVPESLECGMIKTLSYRLSGLNVRVNEKDAVFG